jgi:methyltransferase (TIGR00027 family)
MLRFISSHDDPVANPDRLSGAFLGRSLRLLVAVPPLRRAICRGVRRRFPGGIEYQAARTRHLDGILLRALGEGVSQVVILGVGYDTRPYRFRDELAGVRTFEVDRPGTLARRARLAGSALPPVPAERVGVDFDRDDLGSSLDAAGLRDDLPTLFIWEGVTMFITEAAVHRTLGSVAAAAPGSAIVFDYVARSALERPAAHYGGAEAARHFERTGEPWRFGIEPDAVEDLLGAHDLRLLAHYGPDDLQDAYLRDVRRPSDGRVPSFHGIVHAAVSAR